MGFAENIVWATICLMLYVNKPTIMACVVYLRLLDVCTQRGVCYGRGRCECGECVCSRDYDMTFCSRCISVRHWYVHGAVLLVYVVTGCMWTLSAVPSLRVVCTEHDHC